MKKIYHLTTCSTCRRLLKELKPGVDYALQDIKTEPVTQEQLDKMASLAGNYEALFSRIAMKYRAWGLGNQRLTEKDYRQYILKEYTFLKRPVIISGNRIFIGHAPRTIAEAKSFLRK